MSYYSQQDLYKSVVPRNLRRKENQKKVYNLILITWLASLQIVKFKNDIRNKQIILHVQNCDS